MLKSPNLRTFYHPNMAFVPEKLKGYAQTPAKPKLLMDYLDRKGLLEYFLIENNFAPFSKEDFYIAHTREMVVNFFDKGKTRRILHIEWSPQYEESVRYENASLYHSVRYAVQHPEEVCFSPSSGFHHANPSRGALFCAFSGQVIASMKVYYEFGLCGAYIDLDGHYGNSIDNSRDFVKDIDKAISPMCGNINIIASHQKYIEELKANLEILRKDDYDSVLSLHTSDLVACLNILCGRRVNYTTEVLPRISK